jgi:hypothetical protein
VEAGATHNCGTYRECDTHDFFKGCWPSETLRCCCGLIYVDRFYLAAEVVSDSDRKTLTGKREIYKLHQHCSCVLTVRQDRCHVCIDCASRNGLAGEVALQARRRACAARVRPTLQGRRVVQGNPAGAAIREETQLIGTLGDYELRRNQPMS